MNFTTKRPILIIAIGYILGIIEGLYFKKGIVLLFFIIAIIIHLSIRKVRKTFLIDKKTSFYKKSHRYFRYIKLYLNFNSILILLITACLSSYIIRLNENRYMNLQKNLEKSDNVVFIGRIESLITDKEYEKNYTLVLEKAKIAGNILKMNNEKVIIKQKNNNKNLNQGQKIGDIIEITGNFDTPVGKRNYKGFDYNLYLKTIGIIGNLEATKIKKLKSFAYSNPSFITNIKIQSLKLSEDLQNKIKNMLPQDVSSVIIALLLGNTSLIEDNIKENFRNANLSHILAISGLHITYLISITVLCSKVFFGKRISYFISIFITILYMFITGFAPSVVRAVIMGVMLLISKILHKPNDTWNNIAISSLLILISNPYNVLNIGFQLSYGGTIGIILFQKIIDRILIKIFAKESTSKLLNKIINMTSVTISAQLIVLPISIFHFNTFSIYFLISNLLVGFITEAIMCTSFIFLFLLCLNQNLANLFSAIVIFFIKILLFISNVGRLPFSVIYLSTPHIFQIILYFVIITILFIIFILYNNTDLKTTLKRFKNLLAVFKFYIKFRINKKTRGLLKIVFILVILLIFLFNIIPKDLDIYFVDVGQGDGTFIKTPRGKTIIVDGGGSETYDIGKNTLLPYILDRGYTKIDYVILSHFDTDHVKGAFTIMENLNVENIIIGKQFEICENYKKFLEIVYNKKINVIVAELGQKIKIEKDIYINILWPGENEQILENSINNNSLVFKLIYKNFSLLFTGDIEKIAEKEILNKNINLKANILKIAHHRF